MDKNYYKLRVEKINNRCCDCGKLITFGNHNRCIKCRNFYFTQRYYFQALHKLNSLKEFLLWFTGFWEGEGSIGVYKKVVKNKVYYYYKFIISQKDPSALHYIYKTLYLGKVYSNGKFNCCLTWQVNNLGEILALLTKITPYIKSKKRLNQIKKFIFNKKVNSYFLNLNKEKYESQLL
jgi:hypothetical protein